MASRRSGLRRTGKAAKARRYGTQRNSRTAFAKGKVRMSGKTKAFSRMLNAVAEKKYVQDVMDSSPFIDQLTWRANHLGPAILPGGQLGQDAYFLHPLMPPIGTSKSERIGAKIFLRNWKIDLTILQARDNRETSSLGNTFLGALQPCYEYRLSIVWPRRVNALEEYPEGQTPWNIEKYTVLYDKIHTMDTTDMTLRFVKTIKLFTTAIFDDTNRLQQTMPVFRLRAHYPVRFNPDNYVLPVVKSYTLTTYTDV